MGLITTQWLLAKMVLEERLFGLKKEPKYF